MSLTTMSKSIHADNVKKGFYDGLENLPQDYVVFKQLLLIITEVSEAAEELRKNPIDNTMEPYFPSALTLEDSIKAFEEKFKDKFQDEIADTFIRLLDLCGYLNINIDEWIDAKLEYNRTRGYKHGKKH